MTRSGTSPDRVASIAEGPDAKSAAAGRWGDEGTPSYPRRPKLEAAPPRESTSPAADEIAFGVTGISSGETLPGLRKLVEF